MTWFDCVWFVVVFLQKEAGSFESQTGEERESPRGKLSHIFDVFAGHTETCYVQLMLFG